MNRRELLKMIALITGGVVAGSEIFLTGCASPGKAGPGFTTATINLLDEIGETIIPVTSSPGAKAAQVGEFMKVFVTDCYTQKQQEAFIKGVAQLEEASKKINGKSFIESTVQQRHDLLSNLEKEAKEYDKRINDEEKEKREQAKKEMKEFEPAPKHYYTLMKQLTLLGFFTSKPGATEALRHMAVPGRYNGEFPYKKGDKAWAE